MIPYSHHSLDQRDKDAVLAVLSSDRLTQGEQVDAFEQEFAKKVEAPYAVAFSSGTAALHAACFVAGVGPGKSVLTSALGFVASANAPKYLGADVRFVDIESATWNVSYRTIEDVYFDSDKFADVFVPVHFAGYPLDLGADVRENWHDKTIIEDACHALGATTPDGPVGNCAHSDFTCFSFHPSKAITTGEGGMVTCRTKANAKALKTFRNHGFALTDGWYREQRDTGFNYRLSDIHAALGRSQLKKLDGFITRRHEIAGRYLEELDGVVQLPPYSPHHAWHLFVIRHPARNAIYEALRDRSIQTQVHYVPLYRNPFHQGQPIEDFPNTEAYFREALSIPCYPGLTDGEQTKVIEAVRDVA